MRNGHVLITCGVLLGLAGAWSAGCSHYVDDYYLPLTDPRLVDGGHEAGTGGTDGGNPDCSGDPSKKNITEACGVFVSAAASPGGTGTRASPYDTLQKAIDNANGKRVYACAAMPFSEAITIAAPVEVFGGFADCTTDSGWTWTQAARSELDGPADQIALTIQAGADGATVEGFKIVAASPSSMTMGGSSVAVAVDDVAATLEQCDVKGSDAADGIDGTSPSGLAIAGASAPSMMAMGAPTPACVLPAGVTGGAPGTTTCDDGMTAGGVGGTGGITGMDSGDGQPGANGSPLPSPNSTMAGVGGVGQTDPSNPTKTCEDGAKGLTGTAGAAGPGGSGASDKLLLTGIANSDTTDGQPGTKGQGGGGGGGAMSGTFCMVASMTVDGPGASGGGGGAGGCGGLGGGGGKAGGSSIAILSLGTNLTLNAVTLAVGKGGEGGNGTVGQTGGAFGNGANGGASSGIVPSNAGCKGGDGGAGGAGGPGGGGRGGHALGILYAKAPATIPAIKTFMPGTPGDGGSGGNGAPATSNGANGNAGQCWDLSTNAACKP
jgi:hypothetical protein